MIESCLPQNTPDGGTREARILSRTLDLGAAPQTRNLPMQSSDKNAMGQIMWHSTLNVNGSCEFWKSREMASARGATATTCLGQWSRWLDRTLTCEVAAKLASYWFLQRMGDLQQNPPYIHDASDTFTAARTHGAVASTDESVYEFLHVLEDSTLRSICGASVPLRPALSDQESSNSRHAVLVVWLCDVLLRIATPARDPTRSRHKWATRGVLGTRS